MLQVRENEISPRKWSSGSAHAQLRTLGGNTVVGGYLCTIVVQSFVSFKTGA